MKTKGFNVPITTKLVDSSSIEGRFALHGDGHLLLTLVVGDPQKRQAVHTFLTGKWETVKHETFYSRGPKVIDLDVETVEVIAEQVQRLSMSDVKPGLIVATEAGLRLVVPSWISGEFLFVDLETGQPAAPYGHEVVTVFTIWRLKAKRGDTIVFDIAVQAPDFLVEVAVGG